MPGRREITASHVFALFQTHGLGEIAWTPVDSLTAQKRLVEAASASRCCRRAMPPKNWFRTIATIGVGDLVASQEVVAVTRRGGFLSAASRRLLEIIRAEYAKTRMANGE